VVGRGSGLKRDGTKYWSAAPRSMEEHYYLTGVSIPRYIESLNPLHSLVLVDYWCLTRMD
jgi:hypothetical protein